MWLFKHQKKRVLQADGDESGNEGFACYDFVDWQARDNIDLQLLNSVFGDKPAKPVKSKIDSPKDSEKNKKRRMNASIFSNDFGSNKTDDKTGSKSGDNSSMGSTMNNFKAVDGSFFYEDHDGLTATNQKLKATGI